MSIIDNFQKEVRVYLFMVSLCIKTSGQLEKKKNFFGYIDTSQFSCFFSFFKKWRHFYIIGNSFCSIF